MFVRTTPPTISVRFALYLAKVRVVDVQDANFVRIPSRNIELLPLI